MHDNRKALIVGAGPGGLTAASALRLAGFAVDIVERTPDRTVLGSELHLMSASLRALDTIGAADLVVAAGVPVETGNILLANGEVLAALEFEQMARPDLPRGIGISRRALHGALYERASSLGAHIVHDMTVDSLRDTGSDRVQVTRSDGEVLDYDLVVGADGVNSRVRALRFPNAPEPSYAGQCVWRASVPRNSGTILYTAVGGTAVPGLISVSADESYLFCLVPHQSPPRIDPADFVARLHEALAGFGGAFGEARDLVDGSRTIHFAPLRTTIQDLPWNSGNVVLIGDAVHATTPHLGYGAGLAIEDGVALADSITHARSIEEGLRAFGERRYERCKEVVATGLRISRWQQSPVPGFDQGAETMRVWQLLKQPI